MAGLSDVNAGMNLDPQTLQRILALRRGRGNTFGGSDSGPGTGQSWSMAAPRPEDPNAFVLNSMPGYRETAGGDAQEWGLDPLLDQNFITRLRPDTGGKLGDRWDTDGNYQGTVELQDGGGRSLNQAIALIAGGYLGGNALAGMNGAAATGAATGLDAASLATSDIGIGAASAGGGGGAAAAGGGLQAGGLMEAMGGTSAVGGGTATAAGGTTAASGLGSAAQTGANAAKTAVASNGWDQLAKVGTGLVVSGLASDALSNPVDTSKFDQLFTNLLAEQKASSGRSADLWDTYQTTFKPLQQQFAQTAAGFDTASRRETAANNATSQIATSFDQQRQTAGRNMTMAGVDPSTIAALDSSSRIIQAKDEAGAANNARTDVEKTGLSLVKSAADMGSGLVGAVNQSSQVATGTTQAANGVLTTQGNLQNANTQNRNEMFGDLFGAGLKLYGMSGG